MDVYNHAVMKTKTGNVYLSQKSWRSVQFLEPKNNNQQPNNNYHQQRQTQTGNNPFDNNADSIEDLPFRRR